MNLKKRFGYILLMFIFFSSCTNLDDNTIDDIVIYQDQNTTITLLGVQDNRCPTDVLCFWQGNAVVVMQVEKDNETLNFTLNTAGYINGTSNYPDTISILDLNIELIDLLPYPQTDTSYSLYEYNVDLEVTYE
tara:strand:- start:365 stop:763 length:399 start_codon:yes stop_codon:yes gene_type:complete